MQIHNFFLLLGYFIWLLFLISALIFALSSSFKKSKRKRKEKQITRFFNSDKKRKRTAQKLKKWASDSILLAHMLDCFQHGHQQDAYLNHLMNTIYKDQWNKTKHDDYVTLALLKQIKEALK